MSQQNKQVNTSTPADLPVKRKRGRPRKDENLVKKENLNSPVPPSDDGMRRNQPVEVEQSSDIDDDMAGQVVSGVIEGSFDAGYLLSVRAGNSNTLLRGVVFQPGLFTPITRANDVAPHARMYKRREFPIPVFNPQIQFNISLPQPEQSNGQLVQLENRSPMVPDQVLPSELQSGALFAHDIQSASVALPLSDYLPKNDSGASLGGKTMPQENLEFGLENQFAPQLEHYRIVEEDEVMQVFEASTLLEVPKVGVKTTEDLLLKSTSKSMVDILTGTETINQVPQVQHQAVDPGLEPNELVHNELKSSNSELHQTSEVAKPQPVPPEPISEPMDVVIEKLNSPKNDMPQSIQSEPASKVLIMNETPCNGKLASDAADNTEGGSLSAPKGEEVTPFEPEPAAGDSHLPGTLWSHQ
uniref:AT hook motif-containing protein n=1 Tax=Davidia involucrata TaxID=16924 RepID=A0A5B7B9G0_DAVIN